MVAGYAFMTTHEDPGFALRVDENGRSGGWYKKVKY
jgi:hypothetical protein